MIFQPDIARPRRKPSLTPMIDVVFFMLASRFGIDAVVPLPLVSGGGAYDGPPRLVEILPEGVRLNGLTIAETSLAVEVLQLTKTPADIIILHGGDSTTLQRIVTVGTALRQARFTQMVLIECPIVLASQPTVHAENPSCR